MIRFLLRLTGYILLAAATAQIIVDGTRSIAGGAWLVTPAASSLVWLFPVRFPLWQAAASERLPVWLADFILTQGLALPSALYMVILASLLLLLARPQAPDPALAEISR